MKIITIGFSVPKKWFKPMSFLIKWCEGTNFSHVYLKWFSEKAESDLIYQATGAGVNFCGTEHFMETIEMIEEYQFEISDESYLEVLKYCIKNSGKKYSCMQIIGLGLMRLCALFGLKISNPFKDGEHSQICVETVSRALNGTFILMGQSLDTEDSGLKDLHKLVVDKHLQLYGKIT